MNTLTDAQAVVSERRRGAARQAGRRHGGRSGPWRRTNARRSRRWRRTGSSSAISRPSARRSSRTSPRSAKTRRSCASRSSRRSSATSPATTATRASTPTSGGRPRGCRSTPRRRSRPGSRRRSKRLQPRRLVLTFFGGEPLLNVPAMFEIAGRSSKHAASRGVTQLVNIITNGLLLTPRVVERMLPLGLTGVKVTLDGDRETHDRMRPLRGGQGTFDRDRRERPARGAARARHNRRQLRHGDGAIGTRRCSTS